jgi:hypothetical protein
MLVHSTKLRQFSFYVNIACSISVHSTPVFFIFYCSFILLNESCKIQLTDMQNNVCIILFLFLLHFITGFILLNESCKIQLNYCNADNCLHSIPVFVVCYHYKFIL